ncbi:MAG: hypothetical protein A4E59_01023 [Syntrophorhabdus sp. PtaB.Bin027]|nr:MAG: hypothetical protein A4E59_01023 [Syntrophorhabdus sp. PtaB.Bin027]
MLCNHPLPHPCIAPGDRRVSPSLAPCGPGSSSPMEEAVIMMHTLRATPLSGAFWVVSQCLMQQRRAVCGTVREERDGAAGDEEPATVIGGVKFPTFGGIKIPTR